MPMPVSQQLTELRRELATRQRVYPDWVRQNKLSQQTADHRTQALADAIIMLEHLEALLTVVGSAPAATATQGHLFSPDQTRPQPTRGLYADH